MNTTERSSHPSRAQIDSLLEFLERNPSLAKGFSKQPSARDTARKLWESVALQLNCLGGCIKTSKQWTKYWADKKSAVKKKAAQRFLARNITGGGVSSVIELSVIEERILSLMGGEEFATGDRHLAINPFEESEQQINDNESPSLLARIDQQMVATCEDIVNPHGPATILECVPGTSYQSTNPSVVQIMAESPQPLIQSPPHSPNNIRGSDSQRTQIPATPSPSGRFPSGRRQTVHTLNSETSRRRLNRRRLLSPPSQRESRLSSFTERFLQVEEQRVEVDRRNSEILESIVSLARERETSTSQALLAIGEGLKLLAEALKR